MGFNITKKRYLAQYQISLFQFWTLTINTD
nr:MAG TPA: hypothetical protein [Caudoviricetes sp.]